MQSDGPHSLLATVFKVSDTEAVSSLQRSISNYSQTHNFLPTQRERYLIARSTKIQIEGRDSTADFHLAPFTSSQLNYESDNDLPMNIFKTIHLTVVGQKKETKTVCYHVHFCDKSHRVHLSETFHETCKACAKNQHFLDCLNPEIIHEGPLQEENFQHRNVFPACMDDHHEKKGGKLPLKYVIQRTSTN